MAIMIKATARGADGRHLLVLGLSAENIRRLRLGDPIYFETAALHIPAHETIGRVTLFFGDTEAECYRVIKTLVGPSTRVDVDAESPQKPQ
jgi:hypothetical protein